MSKIIGIDLGTTNSLAAVWQDGKSVLIPNAFGEYLTPSVVSVDENGTVYVGKSAKERLATYPEETASVFKRFMGTSKKYYLGKRAYLPEELSALVYLYTYLNEQLEAIAEYIKEYNTDLTRSGDLAAVKYAKSKVHLAHKRYAKIREERKEKFWGNWAVPIALVVMFIIGMVYLKNEEQRKEEERQRWKQITEMQQESMQKSMEQQPIWMPSELESSLEKLDMSGDIKQQLQEMLDEGVISQTIYDYLLQYSEIDRSGTETETTEESTDADAK